MNATLEALEAMTSIEFTICHEFQASVTHVVTIADEQGICPRTIKYLLGVASEKPILSVNCKSAVIWKHSQWNRAV